MKKKTAVATLPCTRNGHFQQIDNELRQQSEVSRTFAGRTYYWMRGSSKFFSNCQGVIKKQCFSLQWTGKQYQKGWKPFSTKKITFEMQNTPPKRENNIISMVQKTENQPFSPQFYTTFRRTHEYIF